MLVVAWNDRDQSVPWVAEYEGLIEKYNPRYRRELKLAEHVTDHGRLFTSSGLFEIVPPPRSGPHVSHAVGSPVSLSVRQLFCRAISIWYASDRSALAN